MFFAATADQLSAATPARWDRALARAHQNGLHIRRVDDLGTFAVSSASHPGHWHETDGTFCTCPAAGHGDPVCQHRAAVRSALAQMPTAPTVERVATERAHLYAALDRHNAELARTGRVTPATERAAMAALDRLDAIGYGSAAA